MAKAAQGILNDVVSLKTWKKHRLLPDKRTDSERLIEQGKRCLIQIRQSPGATFKVLSDRVYKRFITVLRTLYPNDLNTGEMIALDVSKSFCILIEKPDSYFSFFDLVVFQGKETYDKKRAADGCLLAGAIYLIPPWEVFKPTLSEERHIKKAMLAVADLFLHPSKI